MKIFTSAEDVLAAAGSELGTSDWLTVDQKRIDTFAAATDDYQWIHVDPLRAKDSAYGSTIAHGFLTLSLIPVLIAQTYRVENRSMGINYGLNRVRFLAPVHVGQRVRAKVSLGDVTPVEAGVQIVFVIVIELEGSERPACVAETVTRWIY
jgi:acyl dehydratase